MSSLMYLVRAMSVYALNTALETYATGVSVQNIQSAGLDPVHDTDELKILGAIEDVLSVLTKLDGTLKFGGIDWPSAKVMMGTDDDSSGADSHRNDYTGGTDLPYFGMALAFPLVGGKEAHLYLPKCKLMKGMPLNVDDQNKFALPEIEFTAVRYRKAAGTTLKVGKYLEKTAETALPTTTFGTLVGLSA